MLWLRRVLTGDGRQASFNKERDIPSLRSWETQENENKRRLGSLPAYHIVVGLRLKIIDDGIAPQLPIGRCLGLKVERIPTGCPPAVLPHDYWAELPIHAVVENTP
jgi:hypothetical protein